MPEIKNVTRKTENPYVNLYELETKDRVGHDKKYYVASRAKTVADLKLSTHNEKPDGVIIYGLSREKDKVLLVRQYRYSLDEYIYEFPAGLVAVSYTHLDVYKRQRNGCPGSRCDGRRSCTGSSEGGI